VEGEAMSKIKWIIIIVVLLAIIGLGVRYSIQVLKDGAQAYLFGYSLVLMDTTKQSLTHSDHGRAPVNHFSHVRAFPDHNFRQVVRPNNDTLYSSAWIDRTSEPVVLSVPDTEGRYYVMPFMDAWTNVFASVGKRTTGTKAGNYVVAGPNWLGELPEDTKLIRSPTNITWMIGRIQTNTESDFENVARLQSQFKLTPLSRWKKGEANQAFIVGDKPSQVASDNPSARVGKMPAGRFFAELSRLMGKYPPAAADQSILKILSEFSIVPGKSFDINELGFPRRILLQKAVELAQSKLIEISESDLSSENGWAVRRSGIGVYGTDYQVRAYVSLIGLGALTPEEAAYPNSKKDKEGKPLSGKHSYRIHFEANKTPPVNAFWSLTVYDDLGFLIENPIRRYTIGDRDNLTFNSDGSLDILIQHQQPTGDTSNWLPAPAETFAVTMRLYLPKAEFLDGRWKVPPIERIN
jgi:hypothetical protein